MRRFIIDTDTGSDDAVALVIALKSPDIAVEALTIVNGNVPMEMGLQNAAYTAELCGRGDLPVHAGCAKPILRDVQTAQNVHGHDGMGDIGLPLTGYEPAPGHAVDVLIEKFQEGAGDLELITLGPLTNVAVALLKEPRLAHWVKRCWMMGGTSDNVGNAGFAGEYNIWADPEAARIVFESGMPITMVGWDISRKYAVLTTDEQTEIRAIGTPLAEFVIDIQAVLAKFCAEVTQLDGIDMPDPITVAIAIDPSIALETETRFVTVECSEGPARGMTVVDWHNLSGRDANTTMVTVADSQKFKDMFRLVVS